MKKRSKFRRVRIILVVLVCISCIILFLEISERKGSLLKSWLYENNTTNELVVASVALAPDKNPANSRKKIVSYIQNIKKAQPNVDLIFFGEVIIGCYNSENKNYHKEIAELIPDTTTNLLGQLAKENNVNISFGMVEKEGDNVYNSQVLINNNGVIANIQRKKNVRSEGFSPGQESISLVDIKGVKIGTVICFDIRSNETVSKARDNKADMIILSNADYLDNWDDNYFGYKYIAKQYNTWIVTSNRYGIEDKVKWDGHIEILNPFGDLLASGIMKEQFIVYNIKINKDQSKSKDFIRMVYSKISLGYLVLKNFKIALAYLK